MYDCHAILTVAARYKGEGAWENGGIPPVGGSAPTPNPGQNNSNKKRAKLANVDSFWISPLRSAFSA